MSWSLILPIRILRRFSDSHHLGIPSFQDTAERWLFENGLLLSAKPVAEPVRIPSGYVKIAIENGPLIVDFPIKNGDFP